MCHQVIHLYTCGHPKSSLVENVLCENTSIFKPYAKNPCPGIDYHNENPTEVKDGKGCGVVGCKNFEEGDAESVESI
jgi:hypothetical protein